MTRRVGRFGRERRCPRRCPERGHPGGLPGRKRPTISTSPPPLGVTLDENREAIASSIRHLVAKGREACSTPSISSTATAPILAMPCPACKPPSTPARAGSSCVTQRRHTACRSRPRHAEVIAAGIPGDRLGSIVTTTRETRSPTRLRRSRRGAADPGT